MSKARENILGRVRRALEKRWPPELPGEPWRPEAQEGALELFVTNMRAGGAEVELFKSVAAAGRWLAGWAEQFSAAAVSPLLPAALRPPLPAAPPEEAPLGVSRALAAVAETGSVLLTSAEGRRLQLLPPAHLVFVDEADVHRHLAGVLEKHREELPSALALHSGPSRSADIGQIMVQGVHGPGRLVVAVVRGLNRVDRSASPKKRGRAVRSASALRERLPALQGRTLKTKRGEPFVVVRVTENTVRVRVASSGKEYTVRLASLEKAAALLASGGEIPGPVAYRRLVANEAPAYAWAILHELGLV
ncbi:LutC/YkgG family protein [Oceanithermus sp.]